MRVLVASASKHGSTAEIAEAIGTVLEKRGFEVALKPADAFTSIQGYDAVVIGSAVYAGRWRDKAKEFVERHSEELKKLEVWLFSSGPLGDPLKPDDEPTDVARMIAMTGARGHKVFAGKLDKGELNLAERAVVRGVRAPYGDFRDWEDVFAWTLDIARSLDLSGPVHV
jgi:menaquinone-dependent protoporphyrinogen oxidase